MEERINIKSENDDLQSSFTPEKSSNFKMTTQIYPESDVINNSNETLSSSVLQGQNNSHVIENVAAPFESVGMKLENDAFASHEHCPEREDDDESDVADMKSDFSVTYDAKNPQTEMVIGADGRSLLEMKPNNCLSPASSAVNNIQQGPGFDSVQSNMINSWISRLPMQLRMIAAQNPAAFLQQLSSAAATANNPLNIPGSDSQNPFANTGVMFNPADSISEQSMAAAANAALSSKLNFQQQNGQNVQNLIKQQQHLQQMMNIPPPLTGGTNMVDQMVSLDPNPGGNRSNFEIQFQQQQQMASGNNVRLIAGNQNHPEMSPVQNVKSSVVGEQQHISMASETGIESGDSSSIVTEPSSNVTGEGDSDDKQQQIVLLKNQLTQTLHQIEQLKTSNNPTDRDLLNQLVHKYNYLCRIWTSMREAQPPVPNQQMIPNILKNPMSSSSSSPPVPNKNQMMLQQQLIANQLQQNRMAAFSATNQATVSPQQAAAAAAVRAMMNAAGPGRIPSQSPLGNNSAGMNMQQQQQTTNTNNLPPTSSMLNQLNMMPAVSMANVTLANGARLSLPIATLQQIQMLPPQQQQQYLAQMAASSNSNAPQGMNPNFPNPCMQRYPMQNTGTTGIPGQFRPNSLVGQTGFDPKMMQAGKIPGMPGQISTASPRFHPQYPVNLHQGYNLLQQQQQMAMAARMQQFSGPNGGDPFAYGGITKEMMIQAAMQGKLPLARTPGGMVSIGGGMSGGSSRRGNRSIGGNSSMNRRRRRKDSESDEEDDEDADMSSSSQELTPTSEILAAAAAAEGGLRRSLRARKQRYTYQIENEISEEDNDQKSADGDTDYATSVLGKDSDINLEERNIRNCAAVPTNCSSSDLIGFQPVEMGDSKLATVEMIYQDRIRVVSDSSSEENDSDDAGGNVSSKSPEKRQERSPSRPKPGETVEEFYVKYKYFSHLHCEWVTLEQLKQKDPKAVNKVKKYKMKKNDLPTNLFLNDEPFNPDYLEADRVLAVTTTVDRSSGPSGTEELSSTSVSADQQQTSDQGTLTHYLVKWCSLPYEDSTWELEEAVESDKIAEFKARQQLPPPEFCQLRVRPHASEWYSLPESPIYKDGNHLRDYQLDGLNWLRYCYYNMRNCILADEMGLGKTIQSITFLNDVFQTGIRGPFLIIAPLSTIANWYREFQKWTDMNAVVFHGSAVSRELIARYELFYSGTTDRINLTELLSSGSDKSSRNVIMTNPVLIPPDPPVYKFHALITTYETMLSENRFLSTIPWRIAIVDEAHRLKNPNAKSMEGLSQITMEHRVLLTGTPLQNSVQELFSLLRFLDTGRLSDTEVLMNELSQVNNNQQVARLQQILKPIMLRRLKEDVEKNIAPKEETIIEVEMTAVQRKVYRGILERNLSFLVKGTLTSNVPNLMNTMMELRKCCNHPFLINGCEEKILTEFPSVNNDEFLQTFWTSDTVLEAARNATEDPTASLPFTPAKLEEKDQIHDSSGRPMTSTHLKALIQSSGKMVLVDKLLPKLLRNGHKILIFSQMVRVLNLLEDYLVARRFNYERIDGSVRGNLRQAAIDRFSKPGSDRFVFLLCTKAGGLGINLTAADTVIIYDSDWNPQNDIQAQARCHRIGQNKSVKVYRLICRNTYEREMFDRASLKLGLDKAVLQNINNTMTSTCNDQDPASAGGSVCPSSNRAQLSKKDVEDLLKRGAYGALMDEDVDSSAQFCAEDIDQILERRSTIVRIVGEGQGSTFAKASFTAEATAEGAEELDLDDPDFWKKWAHKAKVPNSGEPLEQDPLLFSDKPRIRRSLGYNQSVDSGNEEVSEEDSTTRYYRGYRTNNAAGSYKRRRRGHYASNADDYNYSAGEEDDDDEEFVDSDLSEDGGIGGRSRGHHSNISTANRTTKRTSWTRCECHKVERNLLIYGWGRWRDIYHASRFKSDMNIRDVILISKSIILYCWHYSTKLAPSQKSFVELIMQNAENYPYHCRNDISMCEVVTTCSNAGNSRRKSTRQSQQTPGGGSVSSSRRGRKSGSRSSRASNDHFSGRKRNTSSNKDFSSNLEDPCVVTFIGDWREVDSNSLVLDSSYRKRLKNNANKIIMRLRLLYLLENEIFKGQRKYINRSVHHSEIVLNQPTSVPSWMNEQIASWWNFECDKSLLMGVLKHGYQKYNELRRDQSLCFVELAPISTSSSKSEGQKETKNSSEEPSVSTTPSKPGRGRKKKAAVTSIASVDESSPTASTWPASSELNTRVRRLVNYFYKISLKQIARMSSKSSVHRAPSSNATATSISSTVSNSLKTGMVASFVDIFLRCVAFFGLKKNYRYTNQTSLFVWDDFIKSTRKYLPAFTEISEKIGLTQDSQGKLENILDCLASCLMSKIISIEQDSAAQSCECVLSSMKSDQLEKLTKDIGVLHKLRCLVMSDSFLNAAYEEEEGEITDSSQSQLSSIKSKLSDISLFFDDEITNPPWCTAERLTEMNMPTHKFNIDIIRAISNVGFSPRAFCDLLSDDSFCFKSLKSQVDDEISSKCSVAIWFSTKAVRIFTDSLDDDIMSNISTYTSIFTPSEGSSFVCMCDSPNSLSLLVNNNRSALKRAATDISENEKNTDKTQSYDYLQTCGAVKIRKISDENASSDVRSSSSTSNKNATDSSSPSTDLTAVDSVFSKNGAVQKEISDISTQDGNGIELHSCDASIEQTAQWDSTFGLEGENNDGESVDDDQEDIVSDDDEIDEVEEEEDHEDFSAAFDED